MVVDGCVVGRWGGHNTGHEGSALFGAEARGGHVRGGDLEDAELMVLGSVGGAGSGGDHALKVEVDGGVAAQ
jgi:hypothetical protein